MRKKRDIKKPEDIRKIMSVFLDRLRADEGLGPFFSQLAHTHWDTFLPLMCRFWENILFYSGGYYGNPMERHIQIHMMQHLKPEHFEHWLRLLQKTVDSMFAGEKTEMMKERAGHIATVMQTKLNS